jgi:cell division protease FtsH
MNSLTFTTNAFTLPTYRVYTHKNTYTQTNALMDPSSSPSDVIKAIGNKGIGMPWSYQTFMDNLNANNIDRVSILSNEKGLAVIDNSNTDPNITPENIHFVRIVPDMLRDAITQLNSHHINFDVFDVPEKSGGFNIGLPLQFVGFYVAATIFLNLIIRMGRSTGQPGPGDMTNNPFNPLNAFNQNQNIVDTDSIDVGFDDVAGCDEAKNELIEVVDFLKNPLKYEAAGAKIPRGILLEGEPGTGKTLLARAVAGEAGVAFLSASGSEFIEMFVGVGASRVRKLFETANEKSPCVVFIDEIDAIGRQRGAGINTGNDEREQTLNQILTNMDGFTATTGIIVLAATNRADILDSALLRPGRFDRKVNVPLPDIDGRKAIFNVHTKNKNLANDTDIDEIGQLTSGFSGADICNLANEAAIMSVRSNKTIIDRESLLNAYEKITIGLPTKTNTADPEIIKLVSHHEIGHAMMVKYFEEFFDLRKVTINANRGGAGGYTLFTPKERYNSYATKKFMLANIIVALGGRAAEVELYSDNPEQPTDAVFKNIPNLDITTGASNDLKQADRIARQYITLFGMSDDDIIPMTAEPSAQPFLGRDLGYGESDRTSEQTKAATDQKVADLINNSYKIALHLIQKNKIEFYELATKLIDKRVLEKNDFANVTICYT